MTVIKESINQFMVESFKALWGQAVKEFDEDIRKNSSQQINSMLQSYKSQMKQFDKENMFDQNSIQ